MAPKFVISSPNAIVLADYDRDVRKNAGFLVTPPARRNQAFVGRVFLRCETTLHDGYGKLDNT